MERLVLDGVRDPLLQAVRHSFVALLRDDDAQLGLEVEGLVAGRAVVEVVLDRLPAVVVELAVEEVIQLVQRVVAVAFSHTRCPRSGSRCSRYEPSFYSELPQLLLETFSSPVEPPHDGADRDIADL